MTEKLIYKGPNDITALELDYGEGHEGNHYVVRHPEVGGIGSLHFQDGSPAEHGVNGLINEVVIRILLHRLSILDNRQSCPENTLAISHLKAALDALESRETGKSLYKVKFYKGNYVDRQQYANTDRAIVYIEHHFNASGVSDRVNYACAVVGSNASSMSKRFAYSYVKRVCTEFGIEHAGSSPDGVLVGGSAGRGNSNVKHTHMPAILLEPMFVSNPEAAAIAQSEEGQERLARCLVNTIIEHFPKGGLIAFSVGHNYKRSNPADRGAAVYGSNATEADLAEAVMLKAAELLSKARA